MINELRANQISNKTASTLGVLINLSLKAIPIALSHKGTKRNFDLFNKGEIDLKLRVEELTGEIRKKHKSSGTGVPNVTENMAKTILESK